MDEYAKRYGKGSIVLRTPVELVGLRAIGIGRTIRASVGAAARPAVETGTLATPVGTRKVRLARGADGIVEVDVYDGTTSPPATSSRVPPWSTPWTPRSGFPRAAAPGSTSTARS
jgi:hypothetical protein